MLLKVMLKQKRFRFCLPSKTENAIFEWFASTFSKMFRQDVKSTSVYRYSFYGISLTGLLEKQKTRYSSSSQQYVEMREKRDDLLLLINAI
jgi:hypothetical protein